MISDVSDAESITHADAFIFIEIKLWCVEASPLIVCNADELIGAHEIYFARHGYQKTCVSRKNGSCVDKTDMMAGGGMRIESGAPPISSQSDQSYI